jgi:hypothetical protein
MPISELARPGFHFAGGLTKSVSMASMRCNITVVAMLGNDLAPTSHSDLK